MSREIALISDIHGNLQALRAVLKDIGERGITERIKKEQRCLARRSSAVPKLI